MKHLARVLLLLPLGLGTAGCGSFMAHRMAQAPNTYPAWFAPAAPVELRFGSNYLKFFPAHQTEVGPPAARLRYRLIEPADYHLQVNSTNWLKRGRLQARFSFQATVPGAPTRFTSAPRGTVVLLHSYGGDQTEMAPWAFRLAEAGWRCVLLDLRGHGKSTGERIFFGVVEARDLAQLVDELAREGRLAEPVAAMGYSYGAALAVRWGAAAPRVRAVVALAPYAELNRAVLNARHEYASFLPRMCVQAGLNKLPSLLQVAPSQLDTTAVLLNHSIAAMFVVGTDDRLTPPSDVSRLDALAAPGSRLLVVPRATHETLPYGFSDLAEPVLAWLAEHLR
jgi:pimeloyl-ACP methyl ester carboxylesterase